MKEVFQNIGLACNFILLLMQRKILFNIDVLHINFRLSHNAKMYLELRMYKSHIWYIQVAKGCTFNTIGESSTN